MKSNERNMKKMIFLAITLLALPISANAQTRAESINAPSVIQTTGYWTAWQVYDVQTTCGSWACERLTYFERFYMQLNPSNGQYYQQSRQTKVESTTF